MTHDFLQKVKKILKIIFLVLVGILLLLITSLIYVFMMPQGDTSVSESGSSRGGFAVGAPGGVNITLPGVSPTVGFDMADDAAAPAPNEDISASERKLVQNGELSLMVDRVEDAVTKIAGIADSLGGRIDSAQMYNNDRADQKRAVVVLRVPATNFSQAMEQAKAIARKVTSENISTEDITEKFIDMQARLKNLKAEEAQYLEIMQKAEEIEDVLRVSQWLYSVRQQIEQLQGQMNYLSRQVDMSVITIYLSSDPDVALSVVWNPLTTIKEAVSGLLSGFFGFLKAIIFLVIYLVPLLILYGAVVIVIFWLIWKFLWYLKKRVHIDVKNHKLWYNEAILPSNTKKK